MATRRKAVEAETRFDLWWLYWSAIVVAALAALALPLTMPGSRPGDRLATWLFGVLLAASIVVQAVLVRLAVWLVLRVRARGLRLLLLVGVPALLLLAREGVLGERLTFDLNYGVQSHEQSSHSERHTWTPRGSVLPAAPDCIVLAPALGPSNVARGFAAELSHGCARAATTVQASLELVATDAFCYLPLYKRASWGYRVHIRLAHSTAELEGRIDRKSYGFESCRFFNEALGRLAAQQALAEYATLLAAVRHDERAAGVAAAPAPTPRRHHGR